MAAMQVALDTLVGFRITRTVGRLHPLPLPVDELLSRARLLPAPDEVMLRFYLERHGSVRTLAKLTGRSPSTITRRCRRLLGTLAGESFLRVVQLGSTLPLPERALLYQHFLARRPLARLAKEHHVSRQKLRHKLALWRVRLEPNRFTEIRRSA